MKTYVLDVLENVLTEEEANQYYYKAFNEMSKREKIPYIVNENRYLKFLLRLYKIDKNVVYKFRFFEKWCFDFLSNSEKLHYKNSIKKLRRRALNKKKFFSKDKDILEMIFKMSFRDVFGFQKNYKEASEKLIKEFYNAKTNEYRIALSKALSTIYNKDVLSELLEIAKNKEYKDVNFPTIFTLRKYRDKRVKMFFKKSRME